MVAHEAAWILQKSISICCQLVYRETSCAVLDTANARLHGADVLLGNILTGHYQPLAAAKTHERDVVN